MVWAMRLHAQSGVQSGDCPNRPIRFITPAPLGGTTGILAGEPYNLAAGVKAAHIPCKVSARFSARVCGIFA